MTDGDGSGPGYEVGRGRPPKHTQFKPGQSGNRKGRPKGSKNFKTAIQTELTRKITVSEDGRRKKISKREAVAKQLVNKAVSGDPKAIPVLLNETRPHEAEAEQRNQQSNGLPTEDQLVIENVIRRLRASLPSTATQTLPSEQSSPVDQRDPPPPGPEENR